MPASASMRASQAGYTLQAGGPVVVEDLRSETRFDGPQLLVDHGVVSGMSVTIPGSSARPFGVLGVHSPEPKTFETADVDFLCSVANVIAARWRQEEASERRTLLLQGNGAPLRQPAAACPLGVPADAALFARHRGCQADLRAAAGRHGAHQHDDLAWRLGQDQPDDARRRRAGTVQEPHQAVGPRRRAAGRSLLRHRPDLARAVDQFGQVRRLLAATRAR